MTSTIQAPSDSKELPCGPETVDLVPRHLSARLRYASGSEHEVELIEDYDLIVTLRNERHLVECGEAGNVVVALSVDDSNDVVRYISAPDVAGEEILSQAIEALVVARDALKRVRKA